MVLTVLYDLGKDFARDVRQWDWGVQAGVWKWKDVSSYNSETKSSNSEHTFAHVLDGQGLESDFFLDLKHLLVGATKLDLRDKTRISADR